MFAPSGRRSELAGGEPALEATRIWPLGLFMATNMNTSAPTRIAAWLFIGRQLEFNANTKYFYKNRSIPKKKLTEAEMVEINRLYRIIGKCEREIARIKNPQTVETGGTEKTDASAAPAKAPRLLNPYAGGALLAVALLILFLSYMRRR